MVSNMFLFQIDTENYKWKKPLKYNKLWLLVKKKVVKLFWILCMGEEDTMNNSMEITRRVKQTNLGKIPKKNLTCSESLQCLKVKFGTGSDGWSISLHSSNFPIFILPPNEKCLEIFISKNYSFSYSWQSYKQMILF